MSGLLVEGAMENSSPFDHAWTPQECDYPCSVCGRADVLLLPQGTVMTCVECCVKENGEDDWSAYEGT